MAKKSTAVEFREIMTDLRKRKYAPVYILMGEEPYYLDCVVDALEAGVVSEDEKDFNCNIFYGSDADLDQVITSAKQFPMMAERRLVILKEGQSVPGGKTALDNLHVYLKHPNPTCVFVIVFKGDTLNATSDLMKEAKKCGAVVFNSPKVRDYQVASHISDYCAQRSVTIDDKASAMLSDFVGESIGKLAKEIDKLILASGNVKNLRITPEMVERNIGASKDYNSFELVNAMATNDYTKAMKIVEGFARNPRQNPTVLICSVLFNFYQKLVIANMQRDKTDSSLMKALGLKSSYALRDIRAGMRYVGPMKAIRCIGAIRDFDAKSKGIDSMQKEHELLKELIFKLFSMQ